VHLDAVGQLIVDADFEVAFLVELSLGLLQGRLGRLQVAGQLFVLRMQPVDLVQQVLVQLVELVFEGLAQVARDALVLRAAAVLEQNVEHHPDVGNDLLLLVAVCKHFREHFLEPHRVHEEAALYAVDVFIGDVLGDQGVPVQPLTSQRTFGLHFHEGAWNFSLFCLLHKVFDP